MSIYRSKSGREKSINLYDRQMKKLLVSFSDIIVNTSFGKTHIVGIGNRAGKPLLVFHGGNSTTAYNLLMCKFLLSDFHVYAVDTIGHPGKSAEVCLSSYNYEYGKWASEVITALGYDRIRCFGVSFGGGILAKLMCTAPEKVEKAVVVVPAGIANAFPISSVKMMVPLIKYRVTKKRRYLKETALYMALSEDILDSDTMDIVKDSFDNVKTKIGMPANVSSKRLKSYQAPTLVFAAEKDCLFPAAKVLPRAKKIISNCKTHLLLNSGHMHILQQYEKNMIIEFLNT